jgi:phosphatidylinositol alpha-mannosyltransferase
VLRKTARRLDTRVAVSRAALELARKYIPGEYEIIPNGVDCARFSPAQLPIDHLKDDAFNVLYVGRLDKRKGLKYLFEAVSIVRRTARRRIRLIVVGDDGPRRLLLPRLRGDIDVHFAGVVSKEMLPRYFASGDVFCSPATDRESFGIVLLEAMASGIPVIGTSIPGYLTVLQNRTNSLVVPPKDPQSLAQAITELMADEGLRATLQENGRRFTRQYRWDQIAERLEEIYENGRAAVPTAVSECEAVRGAPVQIQKA